MEQVYETLLVKETGQGICITINRPQHRNSITQTLISEINRVLDYAEQQPAIPMVILEGQPGIFCTGQDFEEALEVTAQKNGNTEPSTTVEIPDKTVNSSNPYLSLLKRFTMIPKVIVAVIDGQVMAGGVGLAAASDLVIATPRTQFSLSEALWGLLPAVVAPFLIRRVGFQVAYRMALTTIPISAQEAKEVNLVDEMTETPVIALNKLWARLSKLNPSTIANMKGFFKKMWILDETMEQHALKETLQHFSNPEVIKNISNYIQFKKFPWEV